MQGRQWVTASRDDLVDLLELLNLFWNGDEGLTGLRDGRPQLCVVVEWCLCSRQVPKGGGDHEALAEERWPAQTQSLGPFQTQTVDLSFDDPRTNFQEQLFNSEVCRGSR